MDIREDTSKNRLSATNLDAGQGKEKGIMHRTLIAGHWSLLNTLMQKGFTFGTFFVTAHLFTPADFGLIVVAMIFPTLVDTFTAMPFDTAAVQVKSGEEKQYLNVIWTLNILRSIALFVFIFFSAPFLAQFFHAPDAELLFRLSGLILLFQGFGNSGQIYFSRDLDFRRIFYRDLILQFSVSVIAISGGLLTHSYWALFAANAAGIFFSTLSTYALNRYRPRIDLKLQKLKPLFGYSKWVFGQKMLTQAAKTLEDVLVGRFANVTDIGLLSKGKALAHAPTSIVSGTVGKVSFSAFTNIQESRQHIQDGIHKIIDLVFFVAFPFLAAIYIAGDRLVLTILGPSWINITPLLKVLVITATLIAISSPITPIFNALGKPKIQFKIGVISLVCTALMLIILVPMHGTRGAAISLLVASSITTFMTLFHIHKLASPNWTRIGLTLAVIAFAIFVPLLLSLFFLKFQFAYTKLGFLLLAGAMSMIYLAILIFFGKVYKQGPYNTLVLIQQSFIPRN